MNAVTISPITVWIDLRPNWNVVRDQGDRPTCMAMATSDVHMVAHTEQRAFAAEALLAYAIKHLPGGTLGAGLTRTATAQALRDDGQPLEVVWPYDPSAPGIQSPGIHHHWLGDLTPRAGTGLTEVAAHIEGGSPVLMIVRLTNDFFTVKTPWIVRDTGPGYALHAVVGSGTATDERGEPLILIRNSWGDRWGDAGYAWVHHAYLARNLAEWCVVRKI